MCQSDSKWIWVFGGNRAGKTENNIAELKRQIEGTHPYRNLQKRPDGQPWMIWLTSEDGETQRDVLQVKFDRFIPKEWIAHKSMRNREYDIIILKLYNKMYDEVVEAQITWKTYKSDTDSFEGASVDIIVADEEPPQDKFNAMKARLLDSGAWGNGFFTCAMTPTKGEGWTTTDIWDKRDDLTDMLVTSMSTYDNAENLGGVERVKAWELSLNEWERPARVYGLPFAREGSVVDKFINQLYPHGHILLPFKPDWSVCTPFEAIDWGYSAPMAVGFYAVYGDGTIIQYHEIYVRNHSIPRTKGLIYHVRKYYNYKEPRICYIDPTCRNRESSGKSKIDNFNSRDRNVWIGQGVEPAESYAINLRKQLFSGKINQSQFDKEVLRYQAREGYISYPMAVSEATNNRSEGWDTLNSYYEWDYRTMRPRMFVTQNCTETRRELVRLRWKKLKSGEANSKNEVKGDDHSADQQRYITMARPQHNPNYNRTMQAAGGKKQYVRKY